jgi:shikimate kinase
MILLYGHPRTGKTHLMKQLGFGQDLDALIWQHTQHEYTSFKTLFLKDPQTFQNQEHQLLHQSSTDLMALGGSTLMRTSPPKGSFIIYLHTPFTLLKKRWHISKPAALNHTSPEVFYQQRHHHYLKHADLILPSDSLWNIENIKRIIKIKI